MEKQFIYPKNYFSHSNESKNQIYNNTFDNNLVLDRIKDNMYNNNLNLNPKNQLFSQNDQKSYQLTLSLEQIKYLTQENLSLKKIIQNKNKIINDFEILFRQFKERFIKMEKINDSLKYKLMNNSESINIKLNNKELNYDFNKKDLIDSFNIIKEDLNNIENDYNKRLKEKDDMIEKMNAELIYVYNEYKNLSEILEKMNMYIMNSDYSELKNKINELLKEKEVLMKLNENSEKKISDLQKINEQILNNRNENININKNDNNGNNVDGDDLIVTFKNQENEYVKTINNLQNKIIDKDREIQMIKEEFLKIIKNKESSNLKQFNQ